jgi:thiol:disulfide interchange protein DsbC
MTRTFLPTMVRSLVAVASLAAGAAATAGEAEIRKAIAEKLPKLPALDEVSKSPIPGLYEVRFNGSQILYADENGSHLIDGSLIETRTMTNLTEARIDKLTAFDFAKLPLADAVAIKQGTGARKLVVFSDPNCGYCKKVERDLLALKDVTIYTFLFPILGPDSTVKSKDIWCAKDRGKVWRDWMISATAIPKAMGECDTTVLDRNLALGKKHNVRGTPAVVYSDGTRSPGAVPLEQIEARIVAAAKKS